MANVQNKGFKLKNDLKFLHNDNAVYSDKSDETNYYLQDVTNIDFVATEDKLHIGLYKPFNALYFEINTFALTNAGLTLKIETANGEQVIEANDRTKGFQRSGFIKWENELDEQGESIWVESEVDGVSKFWLTIEASSDFIIDLAGCNIVYSDDNDLSEKMRNIDIYMAKNDISFIASHLAARKEIIDDINNRKYKLVDCKIEHFNQWDVLDFGEIREASTFLALHNIFSEISVNKDDKHAMRAGQYYSKYQIAFNKYFVTLDKNDDGIPDEADKVKNKTRFTTR